MKAQRRLRCKVQENCFHGWLTRSLLSSETACMLRSKACPWSGFETLKMPPSQGGDKGHVANLVEFLSCMQISCRPRSLSFQSAERSERGYSHLQAGHEPAKLHPAVGCRGGRGSRSAPPTGQRAEPTYSSELQGCRRSTAKTQVGHRSVFPIVSANSRQAIVTCLIFRLPEKPTVLLN